MGIEVERVQWSVGNGGFHTEEVRDAQSGTPMLRVVYDCGSMRGKSVLDREIRAWNSRLNAMDQDGLGKNVLVISHFDKDHVNGLKLLSEAGFTPDYVILPYLSREERVLQLLRNISNNAQSGFPRSENLYGYQFVANPADVVAQLWPNGDPVISTVGDNQEQQDNESDLIMGEPYQIGDYTYRVQVIPSSGARVSTSTGSAGTMRPPAVVWEYYWRELRNRSTTVPPKYQSLLQALSDHLGISQNPTAVELWAAISQNKDVWKDIAHIYKQWLGQRNLNPYSLLLWSGPKVEKARISTRVPCCVQPCWCWWFADVTFGLRGGWLGTGDAMLATQADVNSLFHTFSKRRLEAVDVFSAPHHGSRHNSTKELYARLANRSRVVLASADGKNGWRHPHNEMVEAARLQSHTVVRVSDWTQDRFAWIVTV